MICDRL
jgi:delta 1-pyrroline-5-carboxylate dehydrogenase